MKVVITGQVGLDKKAFIEDVVSVAERAGFPVETFHVGDMMYGEAPDVAPGKILDLPITRLESIRRSVFKDIIAAAEKGLNLIVNTHATFRWHHGLFFAFDHDDMVRLDADLYIVLLDGIDRVHGRLRRDGHTNHTMKDLMVWREEELLSTELLSHIVRGHGCFYICIRGDDASSAEKVMRLIFMASMKKAYLSFPMSHVAEMPGVLAEIGEFRKQLKKYMICFDPADLEEKPLCTMALAAAENGKRTISSNGTELDVSQVLDIIPDIDGQIYARDFKLIDQSDMIISLIPELPDGMPAISSGVERELQHAHESTREVFVVWRPARPPSPFITETSTKVFRSVAEAVGWFNENGYVPQELRPGSLFGA